MNTVAALMAELGLAGRTGPRRRGLTRPGARPVAPDLVHRCFDAVAPDVLWCGDMTEIVTGEGKVYCASVIDLFSRRALGYALGEHHDAQLVTAALQMAAATRGGDVDGVIFHSDRGSEGGFNRWSQHLDSGGGCGGCSSAAAGGSSVSGSDSVAGAADGGVAAGSARPWTTRWPSHSTAC